MLHFLNQLNNLTFYNTFFFNLAKGAVNLHLTCLQGLFGCHLSFLLLFALSTGPGWRQPDNREPSDQILKVQIYSPWADLKKMYSKRSYCFGLFKQFMQKKRLGHLL